MASTTSSSSSSSKRSAAAGGSRWGRPQRNMVWTEPRPKPKPRRKVAVVYYLCNRSGQLEHPHFLEMESSSSPHGASGGGLYLRDFTDRLNKLRGNGMANMYSWSSKRSYRNGFVWHDLTEEDLIHPAHADEYMLKGSQLLLLPQGQGQESIQESIRAGRRNKKSWSSLDLGDYRIMAASRKDHEHEREVAIDDEISPPPSSSSPEDDPLAVETAISNKCSSKAAKLMGGRMRASSVLLQLISCGSITATKLRQSTPPNNGGGGMAMDRDYFSGSLVDTTATKATPLSLKRSSSCSAR